MHYIFRWNPLQHRIRVNGARLLSPDCRKGRFGAGYSDAFSANRHVLDRGHFDRVQVCCDFIGIEYRLFDNQLVMYPEYADAQTS